MKLADGREVVTTEAVEGVRYNIYGCPGVAANATRIDRSGPPGTVIPGKVVHCEREARMTAQLAPRSAGAVLSASSIRAANTRGRLTDEERRWRSVKEAELQRQITDLAGVLGWSWVHFRAGMRANGRWQVAVEGPLGKGWPDLVLVRERDRRLIFAELKRELEQPSDDQRRVLGLLRQTAGQSPDTFTTRIDVVVWRPSDLADPIETSRIYEALR